jgi:alpha-galactosidase
MSIVTLSTFEIADTTARFQHDETSGRIGLELFPTALKDRLATRRETLLESPELDAMPGVGDRQAFQIDPLVHLKIVGDAYSAGFAQGRTMRESASVDSFKFTDQTVLREDKKTTVVTTLQSAALYRIEHRLSCRAGEAAAEIVASFFNESAYPVTLEMLSSFSLGGLTPFDRADAPERLKVHRFRSVWSAEARLDTQSIEHLHLERSWGGGIAFSERFGQVGSMPVRGWFPFVAVEDTEAGVLWAAQLSWAGSWQMEVFRKDDPVCISGGLADREFGHWMKTLDAGESLIAPAATIACAQGTLDDVCDRLTSVQHRAADIHPAIEADLPIVFNEWCTTWGDPTEAKVLAIADRLQDSEVKYLVIDAGWYKGDVGFWGNAHGDWIPSTKMFPNGLEATAAAIRERGLVPGLWFEMETVGTNSVAFSLADHLLKRDGIPVTVRDRRFWDLNDAFAVDYLTEKVIDLLERCNFGYLKVDYNETIGLGCDGAGSQGEGLRRQVLGVYRFFERIRHRLPDLVIENCSSGGHRLEPSMLGRTAMSSFSDAHETREIPIIAANLHRLMLPRQSQIWAVLHPTDSDERLVYSLAATFLGRMCLSGDIDNLSETQWETAHRAQRLYRRAAPIIKYGTSRHFGQIGESWRHPRGWQGVRRVSSDGSAALVVTHTFASPPARLAVPLPDGGAWKVAEQFFAGDASAIIEGGNLVCPLQGEFEGCVILLTNE